MGRKLAPVGAYRRGLCFLVYYKRNAYLCYTLYIFYINGRLWFLLMEKTTTQTIKKIAILGAESTGKTELSKELALHYQTIWAPEFARDYFNTHDINHYTIDDLDTIAKKQLELEKEFLPKANHYLFCDTTLITIKIWSTYQFNKVSELITQSIRNTDYDLYLICNNDVKWEADTQRRNPDLRDHLLKWNIHEVMKINSEYHIIEGTGSDKLKSAISIIDSQFQGL